MTDTAAQDGGADGDKPGTRHRPAGRRAASLFLLARVGFLEYDRVLFFSDAVFAIAITLLAFDLTKTKLQHARPGLFGFGISFAVIGLFWLGHHAIFRYITALDRRLITINLIFLGFIALLPYPTRLLSLRHNGPPNVGPVVFYAACSAAAGLAETAMWLYATR
jgi:uncharacterized membrane protein